MKKIYLYLLILILLGGIYIFNQRTGKIGYSIYDFQLEGFNKGEVSKIVFKGKDKTDIYALFFSPPNKKKKDVVIFLPGAKVKKESGKGYAKLFMDKGYGTFVLDQRGIGETKAKVSSFQEDFESYLKGGEVFQMLMVDDVLRAVDILKNMKEVDDVVLLGESMGGRNALIAGGLDDRIKAVIGISTAGYFIKSGNTKINEFISFINPNNYIGRISPRGLLMIHSVHDNVIPINDAKKTFSFAKDPKKFVEINDDKCSHGFCDKMKDDIMNFLERVFD